MNMMNVIIFVVSFSAVFLAKACTAEYTITGNHWGGSNNIEDAQKYAETIVEEFAQLVRNRDTENLVKKFTDNIVLEYEGYPKAVGREDAKKMFQAWFVSGENAAAVASVNVEVLNVELLDNNSLRASAHVCTFDKDGNEIKSNMLNAVFVKVDDGVEASHISVTVDTSKSC